MNLPVVLRIYKEDKLVAVKQFLHEEQIVIGRAGADVQVELEDASTSPIHALIEKRGDSFYIADLGSQTGTALNSAGILDEKLSNGDQISIGNYKIEYFLGVPKPKAPPPRVNAPADSPSSVATPVAVNSVVESTHQAAPSQKESEFLGNSEEQPEKQPDVSSDSDLPASLVSTTTDPKDLPNFFAAVEPVATSSQFVETPQAVEPQKIKKEIKPVEGRSLPKQPVVTTQKVAKRGASQSHAKAHKGRWTKSFAPPSKNTSVHELIKPSKGTVVEVSVAWQERIINTYHFTEKKVIYAGAEPSVDVFLPIKLARKRFPLVQIDSSASVFIPQGFESEIAKGNTLIKSSELSQSGKLQNVGQFNKLNLEQGELVKINCSSDVFIIVRYVSHTPRPIPTPLVDLSGTESAIVMFATVASVILALYTYLNPPVTIETLRPDAVKATFLIEAPIPKAVPPPPPPPQPEVQAAQPPPEPIKVEKQQVQPTQTKVAEKSEKQAEAPNPKPNVQSNKNPGGAASAQLKDRNTKANNQLSGAVRQGGAIKTSTKEGSQAKSQTKDISKSGIFSVFGSGGAKKETDQGYDGAGGLAGMSDSATGAAGSAENRAGEGIGGKFKDTGGSGRGKSNVGVAGLSLNSKGRGGGDSGYGQGSLGGRKGLSIEVGGSSAEFKGTIDREAVRRVIRSHQREISQCYERALNRDPGKAGKIVLNFSVAEQGRVISAQSSAAGTTMDNHEDVSSCILSRLRGWRFPEPPKGEAYEVSYPFVFAPST